ncbi:transglutaminase family protein [uncultured Sphingosinicella sp.]|jgi:transglutaminase-like putative cysteine protease|uniref:transglutaminase family protein n=1 Tax=uncultured Sphingosinicella sp. TaxID=478748 RepID=UPI0030D737E6|tara:strand:- start:8091 stop:8909 length:819 start_codon:yes stop_codon:yes gene_type:complete
MRLSVSHVTRYRYAAPIRQVVQSHRLTPSRFAGQRTLDWKVEVEGGRFSQPFTDGAGDTIRTMSIHGAVEAVDIHVTGTVETVDLAGVLKNHGERISPLVYLRTTRATRPDAALRKLAAKAVSGIPETAGLDRAHALSAAVADGIVYAPGETHAHTTAAEALALALGVCQDHTHALIACAVSVGIPARYVSGYLFANADGVAHEASHAWAELHIEGLGWVGFDAANRCSPDERYIRLGSGIDSVSAAPIRGVSFGTANEDLDVTVAVTAVQQ